MSRQRASEYLRQAAQAEAVARQLSRNDHKAELLETATQCRRLAAQAQDLESEDATSQDKSSDRA